MNNDPCEPAPQQPRPPEGRHEREVAEIRACLRSNDTAGAHRRFARLTAELLPSIARRAEADLGRYHREMPEEGIAEAFLLLWKRVSDLGTNSSALHWERRFQQSLKFLLSDAFKSVRTEKHGLSEKQGAWETLDTEALPTGSEGASTMSALYDIGDPGWEDAFYAPWGDATARALRDSVPDRRWAEALTMEADGYERREIAAYFGCTEKTIYNWTVKAKDLLQARILDTYMLDPQGRPIAGTCRYRA